MNAYKRVSFVGYVIIVFGLIVSVYGFSFLLEQMDLEANGVRVKGEVIDINEKAIYRSPWVKFKTLEGKEVIFLSELEVNVDMFNYTIGQEVDVIYHKDDPSNAKIDAFWENNFLQIFLGCFGLLLILIGIFVRRRFKKKAARYEAQRGY